MHSESQLRDAYSISRITFRQALSDLERDGLLERVSGKGTSGLNRGHIEGTIGLTGCGENVAPLGLDHSYRTLKAEPMRVSTEIADRLRIQFGKAFVIERLLLVNGGPVTRQTSYLSSWIVNKATPNAFEVKSLDHASLYRAIEQAEVRMFRADEIVEPGQATSEETA